MSLTILDFYLGRRKAEGLSLQEMWALSLEEKERRHNYIQYLFPTEEKSKFNPQAPIVTPNEIILFNKTDLLKDRLRQSLVEMLKFYGLIYRDERIRENSRTFNERSNVWMTPGNHNYLRISRMIQSLGLLGLKYEGKLFFVALCAIYKKYPERITSSTMKEWIARARKYLL